MKITAEFNTVGEILEFITTFGANTIMPIKEIQEKVKKEASIVEGDTQEKMKKEDKPEKGKASKAKKEEPKKMETEQIFSSSKEELEPVKEESKDIEHKEEVKKFTKEEVRAVFTKLIKAGKREDAKSITEKYGATKISEIDEKDYAAVTEEVEALL